MTKEKNLYTNCIDCTQQFKHCGNPFRCDTYLGCTFNCTYCFARAKNTQNAWNDKVKKGDISMIKRFFDKSLAGEKQYKDYNVEMFRHGVPLHVGGLSDPFQHIEFTKHGGVTKELIELSNQYNYPVIFSTKAASLPQEYWDLLDPSRHAFQISLIGYNKEFIDKYELNTPTPQERLDFVRELKSRGFWVAIRIQPMINLDEAKLILEKIKGDVSYVTIEHLKIALDNKEVLNIFKEEFNSGEYYVPKTGARNYELIPSIKEANFKELSDIANSYGVKVGCGDNDLHHLTQSRCCCGIDMIGGLFDNYMKYNTTYMMTGDYDLEELWTPSNLYRLPNAEGARYYEKVKSFKDWTDDYILTNKHLIYASGKTEILKDIDPKVPIQKSLL